MLSVRGGWSALSLPGFAVVVLSCCQPSEGRGSSAVGKSTAVEPRARVEAVLREVPLIDGHNDVPWQYLRRAQNHVAELDLREDLTQIDPPMQTDIPRLRAGGVGGQFWSVFTATSTAGPGAARAVLEQIDLVHRMVDAHPEDLEVAYTAADVRRIHGAGRIASLMGIEGGHCLENSLAVLRQLYRAGARYMTVTHSANTDWADACSDDPEHDGLHPFGVEVVREMNRMGMLVDLSHVSPATMHDALDVVEAPPIFSHSGARAVCDHVRNVPDDVLRRLRDTDGVVMVTFVQSFVSEEVRLHSERSRAERERLEEELDEHEEARQQRMEAWREQNPRPQATLAQVADHIDHIREVAGVEHIGVGGDYDGMGPGPVGLEDVSCYPDLLVELIHRGYSDDDLRRISGENLLRVFEEAEQAAARLQQERPASDVLFEELNGE